MNKKLSTKGISETLPFFITEKKQHTQTTRQAGPGLKGLKVCILHWYNS